MEDTKSVDQALDRVNAVQYLIKEAQARYQLIVEEIGRQRAEPADCTAESIARLKLIKALEKEAERLQEAAHRPKELLDAALESLRAQNGVSTISVVTPEIGALVLKRLRQGYGLKQVALMVGCASSTISNIKAGRYQYSSLPVESKVGARGRI